MKKKYWVIILMSLFFLAVSAFHYDGTKNHANANKGVTVDDTKLIKKDQVNEPVDLEKRTDLPPETTSDISENHSKINPEKTNEKVNEDNNKPSNQGNHKTDPNALNNKTVDTITIGGSVYALIMDENKYPNLVDYIEVARNHGAKLYGIPNSDVMAIMKDGKQIVSISTGVKGVLPEYVDVVRGLFSDEYKGIQDNIDFVLETRATVTVKFPNSYTAYSIELSEGYLVINHIN